MELVLGLVDQQLAPILAGAGAHRHIVGIGESTILTCSLLNIHCMTMFHQLGDTRRGHTYPILIVLNLFWNTDFHSHKDF